MFRLGVTMLTSGKVVLVLFAVVVIRRE